MAPETEDVVNVVESDDVDKTVVADTVENESARPRKRARVDVEDDTGSDAPPALQQKAPTETRTYVRDDKYYFSDGSCILLIEDTLFNVHRTLLSRDSSSFDAMFTLPQGGKQVEGATDDDPIVLSGDTVGQFRNFLWALYALPPELMVVHTPDADLSQLIDIARVSNKYSFKSLETWALDAIQEYVNIKPCRIINMASHTTLSSTSSTNSSFLDQPSSEQITQLITLAQMCNHEKLLNTMVGLLKQLMSTSLHYAYLAMTLADELNLRSLKGGAYLEVMHKAKVVTRSRANGDGSAVEGSIDALQRLVVSPAQQLRLLCGYHALTRTWEHLRTHPPTFDHSSSCGATWHQHGCTQSWMEFWKEKTKGEAVLGLGLADALGRLKVIAKDFDKWGTATYMHHDCRMSAKRGIQDKIKQVEEALPDYFSDGMND